MFFLARTLGKTVRQLQREISSSEITEWMEYYKLEPFGDDWLQAAVVASTTANVWSKRKYTPDHFMPKTRGTRKSAKEVEAQLMQFAMQHNARVERAERQRKKAT